MSGVRLAEGRQGLLSGYSDDDSDGDSVEKAPETAAGDPAADDPLLSAFLKVWT